MPRSLPVVVVVIVLLGYGVAEGLWTDRWALSSELEQAPEKLARLPNALGPWQGQDEELDARQVDRAELRGHLLRRYVHAETGEALTVLAVCGRPGPIAVHSPTICFGGAGFAPTAARTRHLVKAESLSSPVELWSERYQKAGAAIPEALHVYYGWCTSGAWCAADSPRLHFASARALYKLYVVRHLARPDEPAEQDPTPGFLQLLMPELNRCLFPTP